MIVPPRAIYQPGICSCVIVYAGTETEAPCTGITSGPDEPFCEICTERHQHDGRTQRGEILVRAKIRRREMSDE